METESDGYGILPTMVRLFGGAGPDAEGDQHETIAMVHHSLRRQAPGTAELHRASAEIDPAQTRTQKQDQAAKAFRQETLQRPGGPARDDVRGGTLLIRSDRAIARPDRPSLFFIKAISNVP